MSAPEVVATSPLASEAPGGWAAADRLTTQHPRYANVFALGDVAAGNVLAHLEGRPLNAHYDSYTVCPLITGYNSVIMAEFDYSQQPISSFLVDPTKERWSMWLLKTKVLPGLYWHRMLRGLPHEGRHLKPLAPLPMPWAWTTASLPPPPRQIQATPARAAEGRTELARTGPRSPYQRRPTWLTPPPPMDLTRDAAQQTIDQRGQAIFCLSIGPW